MATTPGMQGWRYNDHMALLDLLDAAFDDALSEVAQSQHETDADVIGSRLGASALAHVPLTPLFERSMAEDALQERRMEQYPQSGVAASNLSHIFAR